MRLEIAHRSALSKQPQAKPNRSNRGGVGNDAVAAYRSLSSDPKRQQALFDAMAEGRKQLLIRSRTTTDEEGKPVPGKVHPGEIELIERYRLNKTD
jgi:hypothetical protein